MRRMTFDKWLQVWIAVIGLPAVLLINLGCPWAAFIGLAGQPAWLLATARRRQWGMFVLCLAYTASWAVGCWRFLCVGG